MSPSPTYPRRSSRLFPSTASAAALVLLLAGFGCEAPRHLPPEPEAVATAPTRDLVCVLGQNGAILDVPPPEGLAVEPRSCRCADGLRATCLYVDVDRGDRRRSQVLPIGDPVDVSLELGGATALRFSVAVLAAASDEDVDESSEDAPSFDVSLTVTSSDGGARQWREQLVQGQSWHDAALDLAGLSTGPATLRLEAEGPSSPSYLAVGMPRLVLPAAPAGAPNVLVYLIDTLRPDHMSLYGYERGTTPRIDEIFAGGVVFERAYSTAAWTRPGTASLLTSLHPTFHEANPDQSLPDGIVTLAEHLRAAGFTTLAFVANGNVYGEGLGFEQGFDRFLALRPLPRQRYHYPGRWEAGYYRHAKDIHREVLGQLPAIGGERFFVYVHAVDPHAPYTPPPRHQLDPFVGRFSDTGYDGPLQPETIRRKYLKGTTPTDADLLYINGLYDDDIAYQDDAFGELRDELAARGLTQQLVTVMTADHGEEIHDHGDWEHGGRIYEEQLRIPLAFHFGRGLETVPARRIALPVQIIDVMPTLVRWLGLEAPAAMQGEDLGPLLSGLEPPDRIVTRPIYGEELRERYDLYSYMDNDWKLTFKTHHEEWRQWGGPDEVQLYDLAQDPGEQQDLAGAEPGRAEAMMRDMLAHRKRLATAFAASSESGGPGGRELGAETRKQLEALGYVE